MILSATCFPYSSIRILGAMKERKKEGKRTKKKEGKKNEAVSPAADARRSAQPAAADALQHIFT